jgi:processing peptidase subunit beta
MVDVEVERGKAHIYNKLLNQNDPVDIMKGIGRQIHYLGRRIPRSETAKRVAHLDNHHIKHLANEWFYDAEPSFTNWGPIEAVSSIGSYKYYKINTMSTITNAHHSLFT